MEEIFTMMSGRQKSEQRILMTKLLWNDCEYGKSNKMEKSEFLSN